MGEIVTKTSKSVGQHSLSVIVPAYNAEETIGRCIESLLNQTIREKIPTEIIIVNDGSTDKTIEIVQRYPVTLINTPHKGRSAAKNIGYRNSSGDVIFFAEADAYYAYDHIELLLNHLNDPMVGTVIGSGEPWPSKGIIYKFWTELYKLRRINRPVLGGFIFRKSDIEKIGLHDINLDRGEDVELCSRLKKLGYKFSAEIKAKWWHKEAYSLYELFKKGVKVGIGIVNYYQKLGIAKKILLRSMFFISILLTLLLSAIFFNIMAFFIMILSFTLTYLIPITQVKQKNRCLSEYKHYVILYPLLMGVMTIGFSIGYLIAYLHKTIHPLFYSKKKKQMFKRIHGA